MDERRRNEIAFWVLRHMQYVEESRKLRLSLQQLEQLAKEMGVSSSEAIEFAKIVAV